MDDNTRVLACRIGADLRLKMKEHIAQKGITVKEYVTGLIKEDLEKNAVKNEQKDKNEVAKEEQVKENKEVETKEQNTKGDKKQIVTKENKNIEKDKKNEVKKDAKEEVGIKPTGNLSKQEKVKKDLEKKLLKGRNKEDEEEFE